MTHSTYNTVTDLNHIAPYLRWYLQNSGQISSTSIQYRLESQTGQIKGGGGGGGWQVTDRDAGQKTRDGHHFNFHTEEQLGRE